MGFRNGAYATIWKTEKRGENFYSVRLSTSRKNKETGEYEQDFSGFCTFVGNASAQADKLRERDRIKLGDVEVTTKYDKEKQKEYVNYKVYSFEMQGDTKKEAKTEANEEEGAVDESDLDLPF